MLPAVRWLPTPAPTKQGSGPVPGDRLASCLQLLAGYCRQWLQPETPAEARSVRPERPPVTKT